jgi:RNA-binding protein
MRRALLLQSRPMKLSETQKKHLRSIGHHLNPVVMVGDAGVSEALLKEFDSTIDHHELIKVKVRAGDREQRDAVLADLCDRGAAELVARIGNVALFYRRNNDKPKIVLPRA